jgi:hypothetical protein
MLKPTTLLLLFLLLLGGCRARAAAPTPARLTSPPPTVRPSRTPPPTRTVTLTRTSAPTGATVEAQVTADANANATATLVETSLPGPAALTGTILLAGDGKKPWATTVELHHPETFALAGQAKSGSDGKFAIKGLLSGTYDLWVLITTQPTPVSICADVVPAGEGWLVGIKYSPDKGTLTAGSSLSSAQRLGAGLTDPNLKVEGYYAVLPHFRLAPGSGTQIDVTMQCR